MICKILFCKQPLLSCLESRWEYDELKTWKSIITSWTSFLTTTFQNLITKNSGNSSQISPSKIHFWFRAFNLKSWTKFKEGLEGSFSYLALWTYPKLLSRGRWFHKTPILFIGFCIDIHKFFWSTFKLVNQFFLNSKIWPMYAPITPQSQRG